MALSGDELEKLGDFIHFFNQLTDEKRNVALRRILTASGPRQLYLLSEELHDLHFLQPGRDFIKWFPLNIFKLILRYLDSSALINCLQVSKLWYESICQDDQLWRRECIRLGISTLELDQSGSLRSRVGYAVYRDGFQRLTALRHFCSRRSLSSGPCSGENTEQYQHDVSAMDCLDGILACGSLPGLISVYALNEDRKLIGRLECVACTCIHLLHGNRLASASYHEIITLWNWKREEKLMTFRGHTAAVFCVDVDKMTDVLASGSVDRSLRLWSLSTGQCLHYAAENADQIRTVRFFRQSSNKLFVVSILKSFVKIWSDTLHEVATLAMPDSVCSPVTLIPCLAVMNGCISCGSTIGTLTWSAESFKLVRFLPSIANSAVLATGREFVICYCHKTSTVDVIRVTSHDEPRIIGSLLVDNLQIQSRYSRISLTCSDWINGIRTDTRNTLDLAVALPSGQLKLHKWNDAIPSCDSADNAASVIY